MTDPRYLIVQLILGLGLLSFLLLLLWATVANHHDRQAKRVQPSVEEIRRAWERSR